MAAHLKTLFLHPPSFKGFDGGAGARYQARREIRSFWYPTWLAQTAALVPGSRLVDAPPAGLTLDDVTPLARDYELAVLHTSAASFAYDVGVAEALKRENPRLEDRLRRRPRGGRARARAGRLAGDRVRRRQRVRLHDPGDRRGPAARVGAGAQLSRERPLRADAGARAAREHGRAALRRRRLPSRPRDRAILHRLPAAPVRVALHGPRLPLEVHLLPLAADRGRPPLPHALGRARRRGDRAGDAPFPFREGVLLRRRHVHRRLAPRRGHRPRARAPGRHVVLQRQGERAAVDVARAARQRAAAPAGRLRVRAARTSSIG